MTLFDYRLCKGKKFGHFMGVDIRDPLRKELFLGITEHTAGPGIGIEDFIPGRIDDKYGVVGVSEDLLSAIFAPGQLRG